MHFTRAPSHTDAVNLCRAYKCLFQSKIVHTDKNHQHRSRRKTVSKIFHAFLCRIYAISAAHAACQILKGTISAVCVCLWRIVCVWGACGMCEFYEPSHSERAHIMVPNKVIPFELGVFTIVWWLKIYIELTRIWNEFHNAV